MNNGILATLEEGNTGVENKSKINKESCRDQVESFRKTKKILSSEILKFEGVEGLDVYNPSVPFQWIGESILVGRVENRESEASKAVFFKNMDGIWVSCDDLPVFDLQDPFITTIGDEFVLGGVRVIYEGEKIINWVTDFYRGTDLRQLEMFASGPMRMKDIRLIGLPDRKVGIFTRPKGKEVKQQYGYIAKIGFTVLNSIDEINEESIENASLLDDHFLPYEWGGCNQLHILKNGLIGAVGHIAWGEGEGRNRILHYYGMAFAIHPETREMTPVKIISSRDCFPEGPSKKPRLKDVTFTAGLVRNDDGTSTLYTGLSDCQVGKAIIPDPFMEYESSTI